MSASADTTALRAAPRAASARRPRPDRAGFTALELLVAMAAGALAISSIYFVSAASSRHFQDQQRVAQTQMAVRMAMDQLRRDVARAGFLGTPNAQREQNCLPPPVPVVAVQHFDNFDAAAIPNAGLHSSQADRLVLTGNYASSDEYLVGGFSADGRTVFLQTQWQSFRRSFGVPFDAQAFQDVFLAGRMVHVVTQQGNHFFATITNTNPAQQSVTFTPPVPVGTLCVGGIGSGARLAPLVRLEYVVMDLSAGPGGAVLRTNDAQQNFVGTTPHHLVRREVAFGAGIGAPVPGSERVVLEYAVHADYDFWVDDEVVPGAPPDLQVRQGPLAQAYLAANPHRARSVLATLGARTQDQNPRFPWPGNRGPNDPFTHFTLDAAPIVAQTPSARVRTLTTEIGMPNLMNRAIRP